MQIDRIEDKKFQITLTEKEALKLSDTNSLDWYDYKILVLRIGRSLLTYMCEALKFPHDKRPTVETEL